MPPDREPARHDTFSPTKKLRNLKAASYGAGFLSALAMMGAVEGFKTIDQRDQSGSSKAAQKFPTMKEYLADVPLTDPFGPAEYPDLGLSSRHYKDSGVDETDIRNLAVQRAAEILKESRQEVIQGQNPAPPEPIEIHHLEQYSENIPPEFRAVIEEYVDAGYERELFFERRFPGKFYDLEGYMVTNASQAEDEFSLWSFTKEDQEIDSDYPYVERLTVDERRYLLALEEYIEYRHQQAKVIADKLYGPSSLPEDAAEAKRIPTIKSTLLNPDAYESLGQALEKRERAGEPLPCGGDVELSVTNRQKTETSVSKNVELHDGGTFTDKDCEITLRSDVLEGRQGDSLSFYVESAVEEATIAQPKVNVAEPIVDLQTPQSKRRLEQAFEWWRGRGYSPPCDGEIQMQLADLEDAAGMAVGECTIQYDVEEYYRGDEELRLYVKKHELGHLLGFCHSKDERSLMRGSLKKDGEGCVAPNPNWTVEHEFYK